MSCSSDENNIGSVDSVGNMTMNDDNYIGYLQLDPIDRVVRNVAGKRGFGFNVNNSPDQSVFFTKTTET